ncbi:Similar to Pathogenesis-related protein 1B; acc. no. P07053 [Pyronema omphalodes CBS 100304]|uniref:Similar to Pathogenesis-related protein 1B acc. no. P07053 n=1 Tax=Pyronema omphalodes (strain CBS 100304) TaxID=1076935 RepID=U4L0U4_PYROM|nr:Similar to Pathogenesis-related protein 1B; acc. no. P07053 [Pyronema omphalodes CBS 100304]
MVNILTIAALAHGSPRLTWSNALANEAQAYVNKCTDVHEGWEHHHHGDCLASGTPPFLTGPAHVVERFAEEQNWYDYQTGKSKRPDKPIGHFAEIVWSGNKEVGCGVKYDCHNHKFPVQHVCRY